MEMVRGAIEDESNSTQPKHKRTATVSPIKSAFTTAIHRSISRTSPHEAHGGTVTSYTTQGHRTQRTRKIGVDVARLVVVVSCRSIGVRTKGRSESMD